jgi:hypothetical protein
MMVKRRGRLMLPAKGKKIHVPSVPHLGCPKCGEMTLGFDEARLLMKSARAIYIGTFGSPPTTTGAVRRKRARDV